MDLTQLPSTFYRVAIKCLAFNDQGELLVVRNNDGEIEIPGGGWERGEIIEECVQRELMEELGVRAKTIHGVKTVLQGMSERGWGVIRVAVAVELESLDFVMEDPEVLEAFFVDQDAFQSLNFCPLDASFLQAANIIWTD